MLYVVITPFVRVYVCVAMQAACMRVRTHDIYELQRVLVRNCHAT